MLDKITLEWFEGREEDLYYYRGYYCTHCKYFNSTANPFYRYCLTEVNCPITGNDYKDSAEFEARVARCATIGSYLTIGDMPFECIKKQSTQELALMSARLQVEAEMEEQNARQEHA